MRRILLVLALSSIAPCSVLPAQQVPVRFARWEPPRFVPESDTVSTSRGDYRYQGLVIGGLVLGAFAAWLGSRPFSGDCLQEPGIPCNRDEDRLEGGLVGGLLGAAVGGGLGYLVGRFSPKKPRPQLEPAPENTPMGLPDSVRIVTGYQHWRGAGLGLLIGTGVGALAGGFLGAMIDCYDCSEQPSAGEGALILGLLGAGTGSVLGFLAGLASPKYAWVPRNQMID
jgi:hypothetical protein